MRRLTNDTREHITKLAVHVAFKKRKDELATREAELAIECYNAAFPEDIRNIIAAVPEGWLLKNKFLTFKVGDAPIRLCADTDMPIPKSSDFSYLGTLGTLTGKLASRVKTFSQERKDMQQQYAEAESKVLAFLAGFHTFKQLDEAWPEGKQFYPDQADINVMLGLEAGA